MYEVDYEIIVFKKDSDYPEYSFKINITPEEVRNVIGKWGQSSILPEDVNPYASFLLTSLETKALDSYLEDEEFTWNHEQEDYYLECSEV